MRGNDRNAPAVLTHQAIGSREGDRVAFRSKSCHDPKLRTKDYGSFVGGTTVSRKGVARQTVAIHIPADKQRQGDRG